MVDEAPRPEPSSVARVESLRVRNFRALHDLELRDLTPLTAFVGPNGSGKSTVFDVFAFLHDAFTTSLKTAVENRFGMRELRTRGESGPISIELVYRTAEEFGTHLYTAVFDEIDGSLTVLGERLIYTPPEESDERGVILDLKQGFGPVKNTEGSSSALSLNSSDELGASFLGRFNEFHTAVTLRRFISGWYLSDIDATDVRRIPEAGPQQRLSPTGDNVANVLEWISERHPEQLDTIFRKLRERVPQLERIAPIETGDGRFLLQLKDAPFERAIPARYASEGTLKLLAYLVALYGQEAPTLMGFEEPEDNLPPQLLYGLAEEFRIAAQRSQILVNTHSPFFLNALHPEEVRILYRDEKGFTQSVRASDIRGIPDAIEAGALLGDLWSEGFFGVGDPLRNGGLPTRPGGR